MFFILCNSYTNQVKIQLQRTVRMFQYWIVRELWYFSQKTYMYAAKANFYFTGVGKGLHGKPLSYIKQNWSKVSEIQPW